MAMVMIIISVRLSENGIIKNVIMVFADFLCEGSVMCVDGKIIFVFLVVCVAIFSSNCVRLMFK